MMQFPKLLETLWWQQRAWCEYGAKLFRFYSLKTNYRLLFNPLVATALVSDAHKTVVVNPLWPVVPKGVTIRHFLTGVAFHIAMLKGFLAHEAGHVRFSGDKPTGLLGDVWNMLEDERIEHLMCRDHSDLAPVFTMLGDLFAARAHSSGKMQGHSLEGVLYWRWCHDQDVPLWQAANQREWATIRLLVEAAWVAPDSDEVTLIAKIILRCLGIPEDAPSDEQFAFLSASGGGTKGSSSEEDAGDEPSVPPLEPDEMLEQLAGLLFEVEPYVRDLVNALQPPAKVLTPQPTRSRGHFSFERYHARREHIFRAKPREPQKPPGIGLCLDLSGSMGDAREEGSGLYGAQRLAVLLEQTCHLAGIPLTIVGFNHEARVIREKTTSNDEALRRLAGVEASGGTSLASGIELVNETLRQPCLCLVVCDGFLEEDDEVRCVGLVRQARGIEYLPILISDAEESKHVYERIFKRYLCVSDVAEMPKLVKGWLLAKARVG
jgi:hypothetical protein